MATYTTSGITLKQYPLGEYDKILVLFTREHGVKRAVAKGARRANSKLGGKSEPLYKATWFLATGQRMDVVTQCETEHAHRALRGDLDRLLHGMYLAELVLAFVEEGESHPDTFDQFAASLLALEVAECPALVTAWFELNLLAGLGYALELGACVQCGEALGTEGCSFSGESGGALCDACSAVVGGMRLHAKGLTLLQRLGAVQLKELLTPVVQPGLLAHARSALEAALTTRTERPLRSLDLLGQ